MTLPKDPQKREAYLENMRKRQQERWKDPAFREKASSSLFKEGQTPSNKGVPMSDETKNKLSASLKGKPAPNKGKPRQKDTPEYEAWLQNTRAASERKKGTKRPPEVGAKISAAKRANSYTYTDEQKEKMANANRGRKQSPEEIAKRVESIKKTKQTPESKARMSAAMKGNKNSVGRKDGLGRKSSEETKRKLSEINKNRPPEILAKLSVSWFPKGHIPPSAGKPLADEHKAKISASHKGLKRPEEARRKQGETTKGHPVSQVTREKISKSNKGRPCPPLALERSMGNRRDSSIELFIASKLNAQGIVYEKQKHIGRYWVDFYIPEENKIIEVNGCFWHYCEQCGFNSEGSTKKRELDAARSNSLRNKGYTLEILWEHDIRKEMKLNGNH